MKRLSLVCFLLFEFAAFAKVVPVLPTGSSAAPEIQFIQNKGQWPGFIKAKAEISGGVFYLSGNAFVYNFIDNMKVHELTHGHSVSDTISTTLLKVAFLNANKNIEPVYSNPYTYHQNYFLGNDPSAWKEKVSAYQNIKLENFYPNINLELTSKGQDLKYDLVAKPHADLSKIAIKYSGQKSMALIDGFLYIVTDQCKLTELKPVAYQTINGKQKTIACNYTLDNDQVRFSIGSTYDPNYSLTIDPQIVFSSYTGSKADNFGFTATYDQEGNTYVGGIVYNYDPYIVTINDIDMPGSIAFPKDSFPVSPGAYRTKFQGGSCDVVIFKFSNDGKRRLYATYLGGSAAETPHSMIVNSKNQLVVFGATGSGNYPVTSGVYQSTGAGTYFRTYTDQIEYVTGSQVFTTILNETGSGLIASDVISTDGNSGVNYISPSPFTLTHPSETYYNFGDHFRGEVICDKNDNIIIATYTYASQVPTETNPKPGAGDLDAWIIKLSPTLTQLKFSKRFGGSGRDAAFGLQPDSKGNLFFAGQTTSTDLVGTLTGLNTTLAGKLDGYVAKMDSNGNVLACTYLGTAEDDQAFFVQTNLSDEVYVMGQTWSNAYPIVSGGSPFYTDAGSGQFIHKLDNNLLNTEFSTVFGSGEQGPDISPTAFLVDDCGLIYASGWRGSLTNPGVAAPGRKLRVTESKFEPVNASGFYFVIFSNEMKGFTYGTYFGNDVVDHVDGGTSRFDKRGYIHQAICGGCDDNNTPTTPGVWSEKNGSFNCNMVGVKFDFDSINVRANFTSKPPLKNDTIRITAGQNIAFTSSNLIGTKYFWQQFEYPSVTDPLLVSKNASWVADTNTLGSFMSLSRWQYRVTYDKTPTCKQSDDRIFYVLIDPSITGANVCNGDSGQFNVLGQVRSVKWIPSEGLNNPDVQNPKVFVTHDTSYTAEVWAADNSYFGRYKVPVKTVKYTPKSIIGLLSDSAGPYPLTVAFEFQGFSLTGNFTWDMGDGTITHETDPVHTFDKIGRYKVQLKITDDSSTCHYSDSSSKYIYAKPQVNDLLYCPERPSGTFTISGGVLCIANIDGQNVTGCMPTLTFPGVAPMETKIVVYSEQGKPYTYVFTVTAKSMPYPVTVYQYSTDSFKDWNSETVEYTGLTKVKSHTWDVGDGKTYSDNTFSALYDKIGTYPVIITGIDSNNCIYRTEYVQEIDFMNIPNVFTPNGDQYNEAFEIKGLKQGTVTLEVFNRWGSKVFESGENNYDNSWRADKLPDGLYFYKFRLNYRPGKPYNGWVQVIR